MHLDGDLDQIVQEWTILGRQDLDSATYLYTMKPKPLEVIGFLCQQSVKKYLKAYLVKKQREPDKTHDLVFLLQQCQGFDSTFVSLLEVANDLNKYAVQTRYPYPHQLHLNPYKPSSNPLPHKMECI
ncbi:MAG: HEPN domain-containing protein [Spirochaetales bacterium]|nr:HEPN domain-containing protein [Spirochaetales bacterium]